MYKELTLCFSVLMLVILYGRPVTCIPLMSLKQAILMDIRLLLGVLAKDESELYTPENTEVKCARDAMICYLNELGALAQEHEKTTIHQTIRKIQRNIEAALNYTSNTEASEQNSLHISEPSNVTLASYTSSKENDTTAQTVCPPCISHDLQKTETFLKRMIQFVQFALKAHGLK